MLNYTRHYSAETLQDIAQSVTDSSRNKHNIPQLVQDEGCPVKFYDWKTFLKQFFKPLSSHTTFHPSNFLTMLRHVFLGSKFYANFYHQRGKFK
jgi:hypothetical protein